MAGLFHEFLSHLKETGVSKTSHFQATIPIPPLIISTDLVQSNRVLALRCEATELPGRQLVTQENRIYGPVYKTPYQSLYQEVTLNFLETSDLFVRRFFEAWTDTIFASHNNMLQFPDRYRVDIFLTQYDMTLPKDSANTASTSPTGISLSPVATWILRSSFPTSINQMPVSWTEDGFHRVSVNMAFEYYQIGTPTTQPKQIQTPPTTKQTKGSAINK